MRILVWAALPFLTVHTAFGASVDSQRSESLLESSRVQGRGKTFVAGWDSDESGRLNPATLGETPQISTQYRWLQVDAFVGDGALDGFNQILSYDTDDSPVTLLQDLTGRHQYARLQLAPIGMRFGGLDITPFLSTVNWLDVRNQALPEINLHTDSAAGVQTSWGFRLTEKMSLGLSLRPFYRAYLDQNLTLGEALEYEPLGDRAISDDFTIRRGFGVGVDLGWVMSLEGGHRVGLTWEDIGYTGYLGAESDAPPLIQQRIGVGWASRNGEGPWFFDWMIDYQDISNPKGLHPMRLLHGGIEFGRAYTLMEPRDKDIGVLIGISEGYFSGGAYIDFWIFRLDFSSYAVELGESMGQRPDRRTALTLRTSTNFKGEQ